MIKKTRESRGLGKYDAPLKVQFNTGYDGFKYNRSTKTLCSSENGTGALTELTLIT